MRRSANLDPDEDLYALFGVEPDADDAELAESWRRIARRWHPDRAGQNATAVFQYLSAAHDILADPVARAEYDRRRRVVRPAAARPEAPTAARGPTRPVMLSRLSGSIVSLLACGVATIDAPGLITLRLSEADAAEGGFATISLHVDVRSPDGRIERVLFSAWLSIPAGVTSGELLAPSVELPGTITPVRFRVLLPGRA